MAQGYRIINLEDDLPTVEQAMKRLVLEVRLARNQKVRILKIIHGFGSSGKGGKIRPAAQRQLGALQKSGHIHGFVPGERFSIFDAETRKMLDIYSPLRKDSDLNRHNNGITIVWI